MYIYSITDAATETCLQSVRGHFDKRTISNKMKAFISTLFLGQKHIRPTNKLRPAIKNHWFNVIRIWRNRHYKDFGLERIIRLTLALLQFVFPGLYIRAFFGQFGLLSRKIGIELYVIVKLSLPIIFFYLDWTGNIIVAVISVVMITETIVYLASIIFLSNEFARPISYRRSLTTVFINYIEICLSFAVIYSYCNINIPNFFKEKLTTDMQAIYFSFATSATVGYGDIVTINSLGQLLVVSQIISFIFFAGLFISFFASKVHDATYYNSKPTYVDKWQKSRNKSGQTK